MEMMVESEGRKKHPKCMQNLEKEREGAGRSENFSSPPSPFKASQGRAGKLGRQDCRSAMDGKRE